MVADLIHFNIDFDGFDLVVTIITVYSSSVIYATL